MLLNNWELKRSNYEYNMISSAVLIRILLHWLKSKSEFSPFDSEKREALWRFKRRTELQNEQEDEGEQGRD